jgi:Ca2+-binding RTX toxin-like protein
VKWLGGVRAVGATAVVAALVAALTFGISTQILHRSPSSPQFALTGGSTCTSAPGFCINQGGGNTISSTPTPTFTTATLDLGAQRFLWYHVTNPLTVPITVTSLSILSASTPGCDKSNLDLSHTTWPPTPAPTTFVVQPNTTSSVSVPISLKDITGTKQNDPSSTAGENCAGKTFTFSFTGSAFYTEVYSTAIAITSSGNPSVIGQAVTYTATVTATKTAAQDPVPSTPTGSVTFKEGTTAICTIPSVTKDTVSSNGGSATATATCSPSSYIANGTHPITAVFTTSDTSEFTSNISPVLNQVVNATPPAQCTGTYSTTIVGTPSNTTISASNSNDAIFAFGANYIVSAGQGNDCLDAGDGNNSLTAGNGTDNVVAGNGNDIVNLGNGTDSVTLGNGTETVVVGNGTDKITIGNGSNSTLTGGNNPDMVTIGSGSHDTIKLGDGANTVTINGGSNDTITVGTGTNSIFLGSGTFNTFKGGSGHNTCHVPSGSSVASLHDTVTNCTVVTP